MPHRPKAKTKCHIKIKPKPMTDESGGVTRRLRKLKTALVPHSATVDHDSTDECCLVMLTEPKNIFSVTQALREHNFKTNHPIVLEKMGKKIPCDSPFQVLAALG